MNTSSRVISTSYPVCRMLSGALGQVVKALNIKRSGINEVFGKLLRHDWVSKQTLEQDLSKRLGQDSNAIILARIHWIIITIIIISSRFNWMFTWEKFIFSWLYFAQDIFSKFISIRTNSEPPLRTFTLNSK